MPTEFAKALSGAFTASSGSVAASTSPPGLVFGFNANRLMVRNDAPVSIWMRFDGGLATTDAGVAWEIKSSELFGPVDVIRSGGLSLYSTAAASCRVLAWGW